MVAVVVVVAVVVTIIQNFKGEGDGIIFNCMENYSFNRELMTLIQICAACSEQMQWVQDGSRLKAVCPRCSCTKYKEVEV